MHTTGDSQENQDRSEIETDLSLVFSREMNEP